MAIYLSAGMIEELAKRLINGGYGKDTPAAIVYKATWREEEAYTCTVGTLYDTAMAHGIKKTAIVLVGEAVAHQNYKKSRLYAADFSTEFREARDKASSEPALRHKVENFKTSGDSVTNPHMELSIISFTSAGRQLAKRFEAAVNAENNGFKAISYESEKSGTRKASVSEWAKVRMSEKNAILFIGACGIAVRAISPHISDKLHDAPVLVMDEKGKYVIPILSAHIGGANKLALYIAEKIGADPVITTATDINKKFAIDLFAKENGLHIVNREGIAKVSSKVLSGGKITISVEGERVSNKDFVPKEVEIAPYPPSFPVDVVVTSENALFDAALLLKPKEYIIGFGCKKGKNAGEIEAFIMQRLEMLDISLTNIYALSSISQKSGENGIIEWCKKENIAFVTYDAEELEKAEGAFSASLFVKDTVGVDNVCERAAVKACGDGGEIVAGKYAENGMTIAVARRKWSVGFDEAIIKSV